MPGISPSHAVDDDLQDARPTCCVDGLKSGVDCTLCVGIVEKAGCLTCTRFSFSTSDVSAMEVLAYEICAIN